MMLLNTVQKKGAFLIRAALLLAMLPLAHALGEPQSGYPLIADEQTSSSLPVPVTSRTDAPLPGDSPDAAIPVKVRKAPKASTSKKGKGKTAAGKRSSKSSAKAKPASKKTAKPLKKRRK